MKDYRVDYRNRQIILTAQFARRSRDPQNREAVLALKEAIAMHPSYDVVVRSIKKNPNKRTRKGFSIGFMETYLTLFGTKEELLKFNQLKVLTKGMNNVTRFHTLEDWFFMNYPAAADIENYELADVENKIALLEALDKSGNTTELAG